MTARAFPSLVAVVRMPDIFDPRQGRTRMNARHNKAVKTALRDCLIYHHEHAFRKHFQYGAHSKYNYHKRSETTLAIKERKGKKYLDLVLKGTAKEKFTRSSSRRIRMTGTTYSSGAVRARLSISWPPGYYDRADVNPETVTKKKMTDEMERWTKAEERFIADLFVRKYVANMRKLVRAGGRVYIKYEGQLRAQGIY